jgi:hypothetical protein
MTQNISILCFIIIISIVNDDVVIIVGVVLYLHAYDVY